MSVVTRTTKQTQVGPRSARRTVESVRFELHADPNCPAIANADFVVTDVMDVDGEPTECWVCDPVEDEIVIDPNEVAAATDYDPRRGRVDGGRDGARRNQYGDARKPSEPQERYIRSLLRQLGANADEWIADCERRGVWTKREASRLIDGLKEQLRQAGPDPTVDTRRKNQYPGKCVKCGQWVEAEAGYLTKDANGKWAAEHKGECPPVVVVEPTPEPELVPEGMHRLADGRIFKVQRAVHGSGHMYAKLLVTRETGEVDEDGKPVYEAEFVYAQGAVRMLSADTLMSFEEARAYGALYGVCCVCAATLTDEISIAMGIGPVCGQHEWADVSLTQAQVRFLGELEIAGGEMAVSRLRAKTVDGLVRNGLVRAVETATGFDVTKAGA